MGIQIEDVFGENGLLKQRLEGYEPRRQQVSMAKAVDRTFREHGRIVVEAPTGTGKSIAYLVPAIVQALEDTKNDPAGETHHVVVATANIALQEQLVKKDLPFLAGILPEPFKFILMKGIGNYLCLDCVNRNRQTEFGFDARGVQESAILDWAQTTMTGDKSELSFEPTYEVWSQFSVTSDDCIGSKCPYRYECFPNRAQAELKLAHVIVCNYHLLLAHAQLRMQTGGKDLLLPSFNYLICDEGHKIAEIGRSFFGWTLSEAATKRVTNKLSSAAENLERAGTIPAGSGPKYDGIAKRAETILRSLWLRVARFYGEEEKEIKAKRVRDKDWLGDVDGAVAALDEVATTLKELASRARNTASNPSENCEAERIKMAGDRCLEISGQIMEANDLEEEEAVYFVDLSTKAKMPRVNRRMIDVSHDLWTWLFEPASVVVTSATLAVEESCEYVRNEIGFQVAEEFIVSSPFDYRHQARIVVSDRAPDPTQKDYAEKVCKVLEFVIREAKGRTLCLFTSYRVMNMAKDYLRKAGLPYKILCHGDAPRMQLLKEFKEDIDSVLLGTESFWAGVDVPGEACSCVVIDKLPFKSPGDPVWDAMVERAGKNWFWKLAVPAATIQLKQGVGRLIRRKDDKGVVIVLDSRMVTKGYGASMLKSLPPMRVVRTLRGTIGPFLFPPDPANTV